MLSSLHDIFTSTLSLEPTTNFNGRLKGIINTTERKEVTKERELSSNSGSEIKWLANIIKIRTRRDDSLIYKKGKTDAEYHLYFENTINCFCSKNIFTKALKSIEYKWLWGEKMVNIFCFTYALKN